jgi:hypothetical protein
VYEQLMLRPTICLTRSALPLLVVLSCVTSCGGGDTTALTSSTDPASAPSGNDDPELDIDGVAGDAEGAASPLYVLSLDIRTPDAGFGYLAVVPSLTDQTDIDLSASLEFNGSAVAFGWPGAGVVYVTSSEEGTLTEVTFDAEGTPAVGRVLSFAPLGIDRTSGGNVNYFAGPNKAYHVNQRTLDVIVWDPESMTIITSFATGLDIGEGYTARVFQQQPILVGQQLLLASYQSDEDSMTEGITTLTVVDTQSDRVVSNATDARCSAMIAFSPDPTGDLYFTSSITHAGHYFVTPELVPHPPCMLRIRDGETRFDPEWSRSLTSELGTRIWTGVAPGSSSVLVQSVREDDPAVMAAVEAVEVGNARPWSWHEVPPEGAARPLSTRLSQPVYLTGIPVDGRYHLVARDDLRAGPSTLVDTAATGGPVAGIVTPGVVRNIVRIR